MNLNSHLSNAVSREQREKILEVLHDALTEVIRVAPEDELRDMRRDLATEVENHKDCMSDHQRAIASMTTILAQIDERLERLDKGDN